MQEQRRDGVAIQHDTIRRDAILPCEVTIQHEANFCETYSKKSSHNDDVTIRRSGCWNDRAEGKRKYKEKGEKTRKSNVNIAYVN